jgi:hypothetical protein
VLNFLSNSFILLFKELIKIIEHWIVESHSVGSWEDAVKLPVSHTALTLIFSYAKLLALKLAL